MIYQMLEPKLLRISGREFFETQLRRNNLNFIQTSIILCCSLMSRATVFGASWAEPDSELYSQSAELGKILTKHSLNVVCKKELCLYQSLLLS